MLFELPIKMAQFALMDAWDAVADRVSPGRLKFPVGAVIESKGGARNTLTITGHSDDSFDCGPGAKVYNFTRQDGTKDRARCDDINPEYFMVDKTDIDEGFRL